MATTLDMIAIVIKKVPLVGLILHEARGYSKEKKKLKSMLTLSVYVALFKLKFFSYFILPLIFRISFIEKQLIM